MKKGVFCISIDTELMWGRKDKNIEKYRDLVSKERQIIQRLLRLFRKYQTPVTWAITAKMIERKPRNKSEDIWYWPEIVNLIKKDKIHEIGCHSYEHPEFSSLSKTEAENDLKRSIGVFNKFKIKPVSFVFPRNKIAHLYLLPKYGFKIYRDKDANEYELLLPQTPSTYSIQKKEKLFVTQGSMYFVSGRGKRKYIPNFIRPLKIKMGIDKAIKNKNVFHLWFHPMDFAVDSDKLFCNLENVLEYANQQKQKSLLGILTMQNLKYE